MFFVIKTLLNVCICELLSSFFNNCLQDRDEDDIQAVASRNAAIINDDDDDDSNEPSILQMAKLPERSTSPEIVKQERAEAAEPEPGLQRVKCMLCSAFRDVEFMENK